MGNLQYNGTLITPMRAILEKKNNEILKEEERSYHILQASQIWKLLNLPGPVIQEFCVKKGVGLHKVSNIQMQNGFTSPHFRIPCSSQRGHLLHNAWWSSECNGKHIWQTFKAIFNTSIAQEYKRSISMQSIIQLGVCWPNTLFYRMTTMKSVSISVDAAV